MKPRRTTEQMQELVASVETLANEKGISKADACRNLGIPTSQYYNTKQKIPGKKARKNTEIVMQKFPIAQPTFVPRPRAAERVIVVACDAHTIRELLNL